MKETFYQPLENQRLLCYSQLHSELSDLLLAPVLNRYHHLNSSHNSQRNISLAIDVGCEVGQVSNRLSEFSDQVLAVDLAPEMINLARQCNSKPNVQYEVCSADRLTTKCVRNKADVVIAAMAGHFFDTEQFYEEAELCLSPGGIIGIVGFWCRGFLSENLRERYVFDHFIQQQLAKNEDPEATTACAKVMSLYLDMNIPRNVPKPVFRLHQKMEVDWSRMDVEAYFYANRHIIGGDSAPIEEFVASEIFNEPQRCLLHVFGWIWQV